MHNSACKFSMLMHSTNKQQANTLHIFFLTMTRSDATHSLKENEFVYVPTHFSLLLPLQNSHKSMCMCGMYVENTAKVKTWRKPDFFSVNNRIHTFNSINKPNFFITSVMTLKRFSRSHCIVRENKNHNYIIITIIIMWGRFYTYLCTENETSGVWFHFTPEWGRIRCDSFILLKQNTWCNKAKQSSEKKTVSRYLLLLFFWNTLISAWKNVIFLISDSYFKKNLMCLMQFLCKVAWKVCCNCKIVCESYNWR